MVFTYNHVVFSIAFLVLMGLIILLHCTRSVDDNSGLESGSRSAAAGIKAQHVAAITAAILAATHGRGRILSITPAKRANSFDTTKRWRATAIVEAVGRRLAPSWNRKRY